MTTPFPSSSLNDASAQFFAIALAATWCGFGLYGVLRKIERSPQARELLERFRRARLSTKAAFVAGLIAVVAVGGTKPGDGNESAKRGQTPKGEESRRDRRERPVAVAVSNTIAENTVLRAFRGDFRTGVRGDSTT